MFSAPIHHTQFRKTCTIGAAILTKFGINLLYGVHGVHGWALETQPSSAIDEMIDKVSTWADDDQWLNGSGNE